MSEEKIDWTERFWNPMMKMKWIAETRVEPAHSDDGDHTGFRIFPDETREEFYVE